MRRPLVRVMRKFTAWAVVAVLAFAAFAFVTEQAPAACVGPAPSATVQGTRLLRRMGQMVTKPPATGAKIKADVDGVIRVLKLLGLSFFSAANNQMAPPEILRVEQSDNDRRRSAKLCSDVELDQDGNPVQCPPDAPQGPDPAMLTLPHRNGLTGAALAADAARAAGFPEAQIPMAATVAKYESGWNPLAVNNWKPTAHMRGMWQIYEEVHQDLMRLGDWRDPYVNARMAYRVWRAAGGSWSPWSTARTARSHLLSVPAAGSPPQSPQAPPQAQGPARCTASPTATPDAATAPSSGSIRTVKDVTSGTTYKVPIPAGPHGVALSFALDQEEQGDWYSFGAHGPSRWDCSGLVSGAWKAAGESVYPQTGVLVRQETHVTSAEPGDLLWHPGHVVLYVGKIGGQMIIVEAPHTGSRVRIRPLWFHPQAILDPTKSGGRNA